MIRIPTATTLMQIAAAGLGLIVSVAILFIMQFINASLYPVPDGMDLSHDEVYALFVSEHPLFLIGILFSAGVSSFTGGAIAGLTRMDLKPIYPAGIGLILMILGFINIFMVPHPVWFWIGSLFVYIPFSWAGTRFIYNMRTKQH